MGGYWLVAESMELNDIRGKYVYYYVGSVGRSWGSKRVVELVARVDARRQYQGKSIRLHHQVAYLGWVMAKEASRVVFDRRRSLGVG